MKRLLLLLLPSLVLAGCRDDDPTAPLQPAVPLGPGSPVHAISDGANGGNGHFFFLPPMVPDPSPTGIFNPRLYPVVQIDQFDGTNWQPFQTFTRGTTPAIQIIDQHYQVDWNTDGASTAYTYRITVYGRELRRVDPADPPVGDPITLLGFADVKIEDTGSGKRGKNTATNDTIALVNSQTLPIKFRIEELALLVALGCTAEDNCVESTVNTTGKSDTVVVPADADGKVKAAAFFPEGSLPDGDFTVTISQQDFNTTTGLCTDAATPGIEQAEYCYQYEIFPYVTFNTPVRVEVCLDPYKSREQYRLYRESNGAVNALVGAPSEFVSCPTVVAMTGNQAVDLALAGWRAVMGPVARVFGPRLLYAGDTGYGGTTDAFSTMFWGREVDIALVDATNNQSAAAGTTLPTAPAVLVTTTHTHVDPATGATVTEVHPASNVEVVFSVAAGHGTVGGSTATSDTVLTGSDGIASAAWTMPGTAGTYAMTATLGNDEFVTFAATATTSNTISFEQYPDGSAACSSCALTTEFTSRGVVFAFTPILFNQERGVTANYAQLIESTGSDPVGSPTNHSVTAAGAPAPGGGFYSGTVHMNLLERPSTVKFRLRGPNIISHFPVSFREGLGQLVEEPSSQITRSGVHTYTTSGGLEMREEVITLADGDGIETVNVGMNGFIARIDDLQLSDPFVAAAEVGSFPASSIVIVGGTQQMIAPVFGTANQAVTWSSSDPGVATVDANTGLVTAVSAGTATITATSAEATQSATSTVNVVTPPDLSVLDITWSPASPTVGEGVFFSAVVKNHGGARAAGSSVQFSVAGLNTSSVVPMGSIAGGQQLTVASGCFSFGTAGTYEVTATADHYGDIAESDELNNSRSEPFTVGSSTTAFVC